MCIFIFSILREFGKTEYVHPNNDSYHVPLAVYN